MEEYNFDLKPTSDFGGGLEFLMNDKKNNKSEISFSIEEELKEMDSFGQDADPIKEMKPIRLNFDNTNETIRIGRDTASIDTFAQSNNGFRHINDIPVEEEVKKIDTKTKDELMREKFIYLRKLEDLEARGVRLSRHYDVENPLDDMKAEHDHHVNERERLNSIQFQRTMITSFVSGIEYLNSSVNPFDLNLKGFSLRINENIDSYDDIFNELYEKYRGSAKMAPEIMLLFRIVAAGSMVHCSNTLFKSAMPAMDDFIRQNPDIMSAFSKSTKETMSQNTPGMGRYMNEFGNKPQSYQQQSPSPSVPLPAYQNQPKQYQPPRRDEMTGPGNINHIISGLGKRINLDDKNESCVSIDEIDGNNFLVPAISRRGRGSRGNTGKKNSEKNITDITEVIL